jgi:ribonuclease HI
MELQAVLHAVTHLYGPIHIFSDSTYVVNCFRDRWWQGWERRGWKNSSKKDVANQDLWKPLVAAYKEGDVHFTWVKGHSGDEWNEIADQLAVQAASGSGADGKVQKSTTSS